ncbi:MAG: aminotransferase class IV [Pseudomonadota bacterium]
MSWEKDRGLLLGDGLFETIRVESGAPLLLDRHMARLARSAERLAMPLDIGVVADRLRAEAQDVSEVSSMRVTVTRGPGPRGLMPPSDAKLRVVVSTAKVGPRSAGPISIAVSSVRRNAGSPTASMKTVGYLDNVLARMEVEGLADDALMMNTDDHPVCTTIGNLLVLKPGGWTTPLASLGGLLPGIVREVLLEENAIAEGEVSLEDCRRYPLARSNSLVGVQALSIDGGVSPDTRAAEELTRVLAAAERREQ